MIDEDIPALIPVAVIITATFLAFTHVIVSQAVNWTRVQESLALYNTADWCWEQLGGEYRGQQIPVPEGYCAVVEDAGGNKIAEAGNCPGRTTVSLPLRVNGGMGRLEVRR